jgi:hypothetical protein
MSGGHGGGKSHGGGGGPERYLVSAIETVGKVALWTGLALIAFGAIAIFRGVGRLRGRSHGSHGHHATHAH